MNNSLKLLFFFLACICAFLLDIPGVFAQGQAPAVEGIVLLVKPNTQAQPEAVRDNLLNMQICCYMGYENTTQEHILLVSAPGGDVAQTRHKVWEAYPSAAIEELGAEAWFKRIGYKMLTTGKRL